MIGGMAMRTYGTNDWVIRLTNDWVIRLTNDWV